MITCLGLSPALDVTYRVDRVEPGAIHRPRDVLALAGGKSLNVARAAATLGADVQAIAPLAGFTGARVRAGLEGLPGLDVTVVEATGETRTCVTVIDDADAATEFYETAPTLDAGALDGIADEVAAVTGGWLALSGSVPAGSEERLAGLLADAAARGIRIAVDTHGRMLELVVARRAAALVKVNRHEASELLGDGTAAELATRLQELCGALVIVTDAAAGAVAADGTGLWRATPPTRGAFAVGSGDSFLAGLLTSLDASPDDTPAALALATAAGSANTLTPGAALFDAGTARRFAGDVEVLAL